MAGQCRAAERADHRLRGGEDHVAGRGRYQCGHVAAGLVRLQADRDDVQPGRPGATDAERLHHLDAANTAADHLDVLAQAVAQVPAPHRRRLLIRGDSAASTHAVLDWLTEQDSKRGRRVEYSLGWSIGEAERAAITALPASAWTAAIDADGGVRDGAAVAELTGLLHLPGWPAGMRVIVRRERPHPGAHIEANPHRTHRHLTQR
ncbi:transposase [Micromonospora sp. WMMD1102]|uniref:transposase n=1 Tax=Micromonospora sp. WMMD1102 TaxID=3016105 RepID=UPI002414D31B|nr:transposase [Micromonospora sp. WMMD1102]MDG4786838.1 transposase [Micromonospora sp. WMMD1102]